MKRLKRIAGLVVGLWLFGAVPVGAVEVALFETLANLNGAIVAPGDPLPGGISMNASAFDFATGLGTVSIRFSPGAAGSYYIAGFFDHEIDEAGNTFFNEAGWAIGTPQAGQSWEVDEPGYAFGDIYDNLLAGTLDDQVFDGFVDLVDDVAMAMGWDFTLASDLEFAIVDFILSDTAPTSGFYLVHQDPDSQYNLYFSSTLDIGAIPEPGTLLLLGGGFAGLILLRRLRG